MRAAGREAVRAVLQPVPRGARRAGRQGSRQAGGGGRDHGPHRSAAPRGLGGPPPGDGGGPAPGPARTLARRPREHRQGRLWAAAARPRGYRARLRGRGRGHRGRREDEGQAVGRAPAPVRRGQHGPCAGGKGSRDARDRGRFPGDALRLAEGAGSDSHAADAADAAAAGPAGATGGATRTTRATGETRPGLVAPRQ